MTETWPVLRPAHLETLIQLYNDGYQKAVEGREFKNPCARTGSQAAAWAAGKRDGAEQRERLQKARENSAFLENVRSIADQLMRGEHNIPNMREAAKLLQDFYLKLNH